MSMAAPAGSSLTSCLAAVTQALPGPKILSTLGTLSVPYAIAAIACAPPILKIDSASMPTSDAANNTCGSIVPSEPGGVHKTRNGQPAIWDGTPSINTVEARGAVPPGA